ncbi:acyl-CoA thioesterase II [Parvularcula bermudensis HTCC2503]|uniref:Acyl-CoA thioesterase 2 n=1 Tax=Parvularcula bermudensis (strain ATCC BAA-594 / HTCC2503 / KCTC 12087) TaxID=314260 RepID=E0TEF9_PARBH|nr:acyl-CoA thioesterase II [Parvularcula bermudensis]ADM10045.1 acyl-CoA thioesterase II [Parvularcula bermudensis HTCC2503]
MSVSHEDITDRLISVLDLETIDRDLYRGPVYPGAKNRVFGGQVLGQAVIAASRSVVEEKKIHSLHAYFMRAGNATKPIIYQVERDFDGRSFATRRVIAIQGGEPILNMAASFAVEEEGMHHAAPMPEEPKPDELINDHALAEEKDGHWPPLIIDLLRKPRPFEIRRVSPRDDIVPTEAPPQMSLWLRSWGPLPEDSQILHRGFLAYVSDIGLMGTAMRPHAVRYTSPGMVAASLDHAMYFHEDVDVTQWLLYTCEAPWAGHSRGLNRGRFYTQDGKLVAETTQEGLMRLRTQQKDQAS